MSVFSQHVESWKNCDRCPLSEVRSKICLNRGRVPADILFIGEAPGDSENVVGVPFVGPAGELLDKWIHRAFMEIGYSRVHTTHPFTLAFTNLVACMPPKRLALAARIDEEEPRHAPNAREIRKCAPRWRELLPIVDPLGIVLVGSLAEENVIPRLPAKYKETPRVAVKHPSALLKIKRQEPQFTNGCERQMISIRDFFYRLLRERGDIK